MSEWLSEWVSELFWTAENIIQNENFPSQVKPESQDCWRTGFESRPFRFGTRGPHCGHSCEESCFAKLISSKIQFLRYCCSQHRQQADKRRLLIRNFNQNSDLRMGGCNSTPEEREQKKINAQINKQLNKEKRNQSLKILLLGTGVLSDFDLFYPGSPN